MENKNLVYSLVRTMNIFLYIHYVQLQFVLSTKTQVKFAHL